MSIVFLYIDVVALKTVIVFFFNHDATLDDLNTVLLVILFEGLMTNTTFTVFVHICDFCFMNPLYVGME